MDDAGVAQSTEEGHVGDDTSRMTSGDASKQKQEQQRRRQKPGKSSEKRTLGTQDETVHRRLETVDTKSNDEQQVRALRAR